MLTIGASILFMGFWTVRLYENIRDRDWGEAIWCGTMVLFNVAWLVWGLM